MILEDRETANQCKKHPNPKYLAYNEWNPAQTEKRKSHAASVVIIFLVVVVVVVSSRCRCSKKYLLVDIYL